MSEGSQLSADPLSAPTGDGLPAHVEGTVNHAAYHREVAARLHKQR